MLDGSRNAERDIELWRDSLARAAYLAFHGQPAVVANRSRGRNLGVDRLRQFLGERNVLLRLDAPADRHDPLRLAEIDRLLCLPEWRLRLLPNRRRIDLNLNLRDRSGSALL